MGNRNKYTVIRDTFAGTTILCDTGFEDVAQIVAKEAAKYITDGWGASIIIIDNETGKHTKVA